MSNLLLPRQRLLRSVYLGHALTSKRSKSPVRQHQAAQNDVQKECGMT